MVNKTPKNNEALCENSIVENVWDNSVPVEKSSYLHEDVEYINLDRFKHDKRKLTMLDLFCGAGGFAVGCSWAGFQSVFGVDHLKPAMNTWMLNHPNSIGCLGNIKKVDPLYVKRLLEERGVEKIHLITGGVPCQGFSLANRKHNDFDERNFLFLEYMRFVPSC
ncbi:DNA cytosine methyltransferase [Caproiciproducens galactitolivorans]|uniref:DNA (cytosine-5-)-methyltransferase n=1 Tax=Caproiciproducens galactitolivorans TaxID=642589 RepID=A0A4Z0YEA6_9FIRM|nr:DNA cytosine methyltransferase [Caproiciproducens galactitolivorans]QEY35459.1 DNA cytosine methyltransferase [Caproiciproducens galactitolivorans]TGJ77173.1 modification methylase BspRI [Caproiciproducens galactitolivorans]